VLFPLVQHIGLKRSVLKTVPERFIGIDFLSVEKVLCCLMRLTAVPSPSPHPRVHPIDQLIAPNCVWSLIVCQDVVDCSLPFVGNLLEGRAIRRLVRKLSDFNLQLVVDPAVVREED